MTRRCTGWDYRQRAIYQITLVQRDRSRPLLGRLEVRRGGEWRPVGNHGLAPEARDRGLAPEEVEARVVASKLGEAILAHWLKIGEFTPEIRPLYCQIMPDHIHAILEVTRPMSKPLGNAIGGFKTGCEKLYRKLALSARDTGQALSGRDGAAKGGLAAELPRLWAEGFQDSILFRAGQLDNMFRYLRDNPRRLAIKRLFPDLFRVVGRLRVSLGLAPEAQDRGLAPEAQDRGLAPEAQDRGLAPEAQDRGLAQGVAGSVPKALAFGLFSALGNRFLLDRPLSQIQVSRRDFGYRRESKTGGGLKIARDEAGAPIADFSTAVFDERCEAAFEAAKRGAVLISPCVSDGEREIARLALEAKLPLVVLKNKGFSSLQKPAGRAFDACSDGRLLMLAPIAWPHVPGEKPMRREDALVMNRLAQLIAGEGAVEINYHGAKLCNVDALACLAVKEV